MDNIGTIPKNLKTPYQIKLWEAISQMKNSNTGRLTRIVGPMFGGKTSELVTKANIHSSLGSPVLFIVHSLDDRDTGCGRDNFPLIKNGIITTHSTQPLSLSPKIKTVKCCKLENVDVSKYKFIFVDEAQFFDDVVDTVRSWIFNGKSVTLSHLSGNFEMKKFGNCSDLESLTEEFIIKKAKCTFCYFNNKEVDAYFSGKVISDTTETDIGASDKYVALCMSCHLKLEKAKVIINSQKS